MKKTRRRLAGLMLATAATAGLATTAAGTHATMQADTAWGAPNPDATSTTDDTAWGTPPTGTSGSGGTAVTPMDTAWG